MANPTLSSGDKSSGLEAIFKNGKNQPQEQTKNFFAVLSENGRLHDSEKVIEEFKTIMSAHRGEVLITVTCALNAP